MRKSEQFDFETAKTVVKEYFSKPMILTDNEKLFIENFNQSVYQPDLLFDDEGMIERIREHPMTIWKVNGGNPNKSAL